MAAIMAGDTNNPIKQTGSNLSVSKTGIATLTEQYRGPYNLILSSAPVIYSAHPTYTNLKLSEKSVVREEGDIGLSSLKYEGPDPANGDQLPDPVYELIRGNSSEPIDTHPDFVSTLGGTKASPLPATGPAQFDSDGIFKNFPPNADNFLGGVQSYLAASMTFKKTYVDYSPPSSITAIPKVEDPEDGPFPALTSPMNWMLMNVSWTRKGGLYEIQKDWLASGKRGWNALIYP